MPNLVYRKGTIPSVNGATVYKNYPLTNDELDGNFYGLDQEMATKAPISNAIFTGSTTIPNINALGGTINGVTIGGSSAAAGSFTTLVSTSSSLLGSTPATAVSLFSTSTGAISLGGAGSTVTTGNNLTVTGDVLVDGGAISINLNPIISAVDVGQPVSLFATSTAGVTIGSNTAGTTAVRYDFSVGRNTTLTGSVTMGGTPSITASTVGNAVSLFNTTTGTISVGGAGSTVAVGNNLTVGGTATITGTSTFTGAASFNGNVTLGDLSGDTVTITAGTIAGSPNFSGSPTYLTFPIVNTQTAQTLQNKTINLTNNTLVATSAQMLAALTDETGTGSLVFNTSPTLVTPTLGAASATSINKVAITAPATGSTLTIADGKTLTASNTLTFTGTDLSSVAFGTGGTVVYTSNKLSVHASTTSAELAGVISDETGSGALVFATSPTLVTPTLGVATATTINKVTITAPATGSTLTIANGKTLTASNTLTFTGTDASSIAFGAGGTVAYTSNNLSAFATTTSAQLAGVISDETGTGSLVFATSPTLVTPTLGVATATSVNKVTITAPLTSATLTIADGKTLTASNTLTFTGTDASSVAFGTGGTVVYTSNKLSVHAATTSSELAGIITDETGSGALVFATSPTLVTPNIGTASASSLSASGTVSGSTLTSTVAIGTAPLTVTSTTRVSNLNADRVDDITFVAPSVTGGLPYVSATAAGNHTVSFIGAGTSGTILSSSGGGAPTWIAISGLSAGSSKAAEHILGGNPGDMLYQNSKIVSATTTLNSTTVTLNVTGLSAGMVISGNGNIPGGAYIVSVGVTDIVISEQATASGTASTTFTETKKIPIGTNNQVLISNGSIPVWSSDLTVGNISHTGLTPTAGTNIDQVYSVTESLTVGTSWINTSINAAELVTGSYMVQLLSGTELYTGMMSWYASDINSAVVDEIVLHKASAGSETSALFLRVERTDNDASPDMTLQISSSASRAATTYTFKFRRLI